MTLDQIVWLLTCAVALSSPGARKFFFPEVTVGRGGRHGAHSPEVDAAKGLAICAVMGIHAFYLAAWAPGFDLAEWSGACVTNNALRFAVPAFIFFSGLCLGVGDGGARGWRGFYTRKIRRIFVPYVVVSVALLLGGVDGIGPSGRLGIHPGDWQSLAWEIVTGGASVPFYFVVVLGQLYVIYPLLSALAKRAPRSLGVFSLLVSAGGTILLQGGEMWGVPAFFPYLFPFSLGMLSSGKGGRGIPMRGLIAITATYICANLTIWKLVLGAPEHFDLGGWYAYNSQYFYSIAIAAIAAHFFSRATRVAAVVAPMGRLSLWIFLLHYPVQVWAWGLVGPSSSIGAFFAATGLWISCIALCLVGGVAWEKWFGGAITMRRGQS